MKKLYDLILINLIAYLIGAFIAWDIVWIKDIGEWQIYQRVILLVGFMLFNVVVADREFK